MKEGWEYKKLGDVAIIINGFAFKSSLFTKEGEKILRISNIQNDIVDLSDVVFFNKETYKQNLDKYKVYPDDILIALSGATTGKIGINKTNETLYLNQRVAICRESVKTLNHKYLYCFLKTKSLEFLKDAEGVAQPNLSTEQMKNYVLPIPPLSEQQHIVEELDLLSSIIEKKKAQLNELDNLAQSIFYEMFNEEFAIKQNWRKCHVGDVYKFQYGKGNKIPEDKGNYLCYGSNGVVGHHTTFNSEDAPIIGHIGAYAGIVNWGIGKHYVTYNGVICKLKEDCNNPIYGYYMLKSQDYLNIAKRGGAQPFVSYDLLEEPTIYVPPLDLQNQFASKIDIIDKQKELLKQSIKEVEALFNSRMDYYFN